MFKNEAEATTHWQRKMRSMYEDDFFMYKIPDIGNTMKPCDALGVRGTVGIACEFKFFNRKKKEVTYEDILSKCQWQQLLTLEAVTRAGGYGILVGYNRGNNTFYSYYYTANGSTGKTPVRISDIDQRINGKPKR